MEDLLTLKRLMEQRAAQVITSGGQCYTPLTNDLVMALDVHYKGKEAFVAGVVQKLHQKEYKGYTFQTAVHFPYLPGYLCFREGPPLLEFVKLLQLKENLSISVILVDGQGIAHPQKMGVGSWLGVHLGLPVIGCAKSSLLNYQGEPGKEKGDFQPVYLQNETVGYVLRTRKGVRPVYVSPGHLLTLETAKVLVLSLVSAYRLPDIAREADRLARACARGEMQTDLQV